MHRRTFTLSLGAGLGAGLAASHLASPARAATPDLNVILVRFGGGVRRAETIGQASHAPFLRDVLAPAGVLVPDLRIEQLDGSATSHAEGTLNLLTGRYRSWVDAGSGLLDDRLQPVEPTLFQTLRDALGLASHEVLLINGEDRPQEEFFTLTPTTMLPDDHRGFRVEAEMLSLHRFKLWSARQDLAAGVEGAADRVEALLSVDRRGATPDPTAPVAGFWQAWADRWGRDGFRNPRGDRLLTELALDAMARLRPRFLMVNYQDPDYVHWGNPAFYTRAIGVIDEGLRTLWMAAGADPFYAGRTVFVVTPDCGRDQNPLMDVPFQHHFNSPEAHRVWAVVAGVGAGAGIPAGRVIDRPADQTQIAATVAALMGTRMARAEGTALDVGT
jgi:hypothetical protein